MTAPRLQLHAEHPEPHKIDRALELLRAGEVIAYPTDTAYAIGCDALQKRAVERVYEIKGRKRDQRLALICPDLSDIARYASVDNWHYRIMRRLLPGPYTFILSASREVPRMLLSKQPGWSAARWTPCGCSIGWPPSSNDEARSHGTAG